MTTLWTQREDREYMIVKITLKLIMNTEKTNRGTIIAKECSNCNRMLPLFMYRKKKDGYLKRDYICETCKRIDYKSVTSKKEGSSKKTIFYSNMLKSNGDVVINRYWQVDKVDAINDMLTSKRNEEPNNNYVSCRLYVMPMTSKGVLWGTGEFHEAPFIDNCCKAILKKYKKRGTKVKDGFKRTKEVSNEELVSTLEVLIDRNYNRYLHSVNGKRSKQSRKDYIKYTNILKSINK